MIFIDGLKKMKMNAMNQKMAELMARSHTDDDLEQISSQVKNWKFWVDLDLMLGNNSTNY